MCFLLYFWGVLGQVFFFFFFWTIVLFLFAGKTVHTVVNFLLFLKMFFNKYFVVTRHQPAVAFSHGQAKNLAFFVATLTVHHVIKVRHECLYVCLGWWEGFGLQKSCIVVAIKFKEHVDANAAVALFCFFLGHFKSGEGRLHYLLSGVFHSSPSQVNGSQQEHRTYHRVKQLAAAAALHLCLGAWWGGGRGAVILPRWLPDFSLLNSSISLPSSGSSMYLHR